MIQHPLLQFKVAVEAVKPGLGNLTAFLALVAVANDAALVVAPSGTGKSTAGWAIANAAPDCLALQSATKTGLAPYQQQLTGFRGLLYVDDLARVENEYGRRQMFVELPELVHSHQLRKDTGFVHINISGYAGSLILNCQPVLLKRYLRMDEWEASVQDKVIRYYHIYRPVDATPAPLEIKIPWPKGTVDSVKDSFGIKGLAELEAQGLMQWGVGRSKEHIRKLLAGACLWRGGRKVSENDVEVVTELLRPCWGERAFIEKDGFETGRRFRSDFYYLLVEFATYHHVTVRQIMLDYKLEDKTVYRFLDTYRRMWVKSHKSPTVYAPSESTYKILADLGWEPKER